MDDARRRWIAPGAIAFLLVFDALCSGAAKLEDIPALIEKTASPRLGVTREQEETARSIGSLGPDAIPYLLPLLKHEDEGVRRLTSCILGGMNGLTEEHLEALMESRLRGDGWIPRAIARVGTPRAIAFLVDELKKEKRTHTQLAVAFQMLGERGVPYLVELIETGPIDNELQAAVVYVFGELQDQAQPAVIPLTEFISGKQGNDASVRCAMLALGAIGPKACSSVPALLKIAKDGPESLTRTADQALLTMGVPEAVTGLLRRLEVEPSLPVFRDIALLKENGKAAGPTVVAYLRHDNSGIRIAAARALGYVGYAEASPDLTKLLHADDWRLVHVSAESLGRLHARDAVGPLGEIAKSHWYPVVREAAKKAIRVIQGKASYESRYHPKNFPLEFFDYFGAGVFDNPEAAEDARPNRNRSLVDQKDRLSPEQLKKLTYNVEIVSLGTSKDDRSAERRVTTRPQVPSVGLKVDGGYLVGSDRGEWGGELVFIDAEGKQTTLLGENIYGIHRMASGLVALAGYGHFTSEGVLFRVSRGEDGAWRASSWKVLPGTPRVSGVLANGNLFVACEGGSVEVSPAGEIKMARN